MRVVVASLNPAIERLLVVDRNVPGSVHRLALSETLAGGKGVNVARVLRQLATMDAADHRSGDEELESILVGPIGGPTGALQEALLEREDIAASHCRVDGWTRTNEVLVDRSEPDRATVYNAAGPELSPSEVEDLRRLAVASLDDADALVCTGSLPPGVPVTFYAEWISEAKRRGIPTVLDSSGDALLSGARAHPTVVKINSDELDEVSHATSVSRGDVVGGWRAGGSDAVIVTDGARATRAVTSAGTFVVTSPAVATRSAVGSGDAYTAGLVWGLLRRPQLGWPGHLSLAAACGASNAASVFARLSEDHPPQSLIEHVTVRYEENRP